MKQRHSWEITNEFWEQAQPLIPQKERDSNKEYQRKAGGGRHPMESRRVLEAIFMSSVPVSNGKRYQKR